MCFGQVLRFESASLFSFCIQDIEVSGASEIRSNMETAKRDSQGGFLCRSCYCSCRWFIDFIAKNVFVPVENLSWLLLFYS